MFTFLQNRSARWIATAILLGNAGWEPGQAESLELVSRAFGRDTPHRPSWPLQWSESGRFLLFQSEATGLLPGQLDFNIGKELFLLDLWKDDLALLSRHFLNPLLTVGSNGLLSSNSFRPQMTPDAEYVVFEALGTSMVPGQIDGNGTSDIFLWKRSTDEIELVSHLPGLPGVTGNGASLSASISVDGRFIAFSSTASDLVLDVTDENDSFDVFVLDRELGEVRLVSRSSAAPSNTGNASSSAPHLRADGASMIFSSQATDLVAAVVDANGTSDLFEWDAGSGVLTLISSRFDSPLTTANGSSSLSRRSDDDRFLAVTSLATDFAAGVADTNGAFDAYLVDRATGQRKLVSHQGASATSAGNGETFVTGMSADGRFLTLSTRATDIVAGATDGNQGRDIVHWDRASDIARLVSHASSSPLVAGNRECLDSGGSASGRYVSFLSLAEDHVAGVTEGNISTDLFVWDRDSSNIRLVSHREGEPLTTGERGIFESTMSSDGALIAFNSVSDDYDLDDADGNGEIDNFVWSRFDDEIRLAYRLPEDAVVAGSTGGLRDIDDSGRWVLLGRGIFDRKAEEWIPLPEAAGAQDASADGRFVLYSSQSILPIQPPTFAGSSDVFHWNRETAAATLVSHVAGSPTTQAGGVPVALSDDGRFALFDSGAPDIVAGQIEPDPADSVDTFLWDRMTNTSVLVSHQPEKPTTAGGGRGRLVSAAGEFVVFESSSSWPPQIYRFRRSDGEIELVSRAHGGKGTVGGDGESSAIAMSDDGRWIAFRSSATNLVDPPVSSQFQQAYLYDAFDGSMRLLSSSIEKPGSAANQESEPLAISADGSIVLMQTRASDLAPDVLDENDDFDLFLWRSGESTPELVSHSATAALIAANAGSWKGDMSDSGDRVAFASYATDLVAGPYQDTSGTLDAFLWTASENENRLITGNVLDRSTAAGDAVDLVKISSHGSVVGFESSSIYLASVDRPWDSWSGVFAWFSGLFEDGFEQGDASAWSDVEP